MRTPNVERTKGRGARIVLALASSALACIGYPSKGAASPVPPQLYGKSVTTSGALQQTYFDDTTGKPVTGYSESTVTFYFSSQGRIFARVSFRNPSGSRTYEQVGSDPNIVQRLASATGAGQSAMGTSARSYQDLHFEGRTLIAINKVGENGTRRTVIEFDQNFGSCSWSSALRSTNGKPVRRIGWNGHLEIVSGETASNQNCVIQEGNAFAK